MVRLSRGYGAWACSLCERVRVRKLTLTPTPNAKPDPRCWWKLKAPCPRPKLLAVFQSVYSLVCFKSTLESCWKRPWPGVAPYSQASVFRHSSNAGNQDFGFGVAYGRVIKYVTSEPFSALHCRRANQHGCALRNSNQVRSKKEGKKGCLLHKYWLDKYWKPWNKNKIESINKYDFMAKW